MSEDNVPAPFRRDLKLYPGPREANGWPTYSVYDPVSCKYFKISWEESYIYKLAKPGMSIAAIAQEVKNYSHIEVDAEEVEHFFKQAALHNLLQLPKSSEELEAHGKKKKQGFFQWLLLNYLYIRIPLLRPDRFLAATLPYVKKLWSPTMMIIYVVLSLIGVGAIALRWEEYSHTFTHFFNLQGLVAYALALAAVKVVHEMAHAYVAAHYGVSVPSMGVALLILWPVLYTDVTHSWKLARRRQRLAISGAGIMAETVIAGLSTFAWALSPSGMLQSVCFVLSAVTWLRSLLINFNPILRFDGYYLLCDLWGIDNLRPRAFAVARWKLHQWLFGFNEDCPEDDLPERTLSGMVVYSLLSWAYLLMLYTVIALFVYHKFTKALGIVLFIVEIAVFFVWPVISETQTLMKKREFFHWNKRVVGCLIALTLLIGWLCVPMSHYETFAAITVPADSQLLYTPSPGQIEKIYVKRGQALQVGDPVLQLRSPRIKRQLEVAKMELAILEETLSAAVVDSELHPLIATTQAQLAAAEEELQRAQDRENDLLLTASLDGVVYDFDENIRKGQTVAANQVIGKLADTQRVHILAFVDEDRITHIQADGKAEFRIPGGSSKRPARFKEVQMVAGRQLNYPALASLYEGPLPAHMTEDGQMRLLNSYFQAELELEGEPMPYGKVGELHVQTQAQSLLSRSFHYVYAVLIGESGF